MNNKSIALLAILAAVGTLTMSPAYALEQAYPGIEDNSKETANQILLNTIPISVWTDQTSYEHNSTIIVQGHVANISDKFPVTLTVINPLNSIITVDQLDVDSDGNFETMINAAGDLWTYDGTYVIKVNYGSVEKSDKAIIMLTGSADNQTIREPPDDNCITIESLEADTCVPFSISEGMVNSISLDVDDKSVLVQITADNEGMLKINPPQSVIKDIFMVLVDNEEWDDVEINDNDVTVMFPAGTEEIVIIGTWIVPEFGTIAVMILAVAIISIIAITARSGLSIMPRR